MPCDHSQKTCEELKQAFDTLSNCDGEYDLEDCKYLSYKALEKVFMTEEEKALQLAKVFMTEEEKAELKFEDTNEKMDEKITKFCADLVKEAGGDDMRVTWEEYAAAKASETISEEELSEDLFEMKLLVGGEWKKCPTKAAIEKDVTSACTSYEIGISMALTLLMILKT